jgi:hypothetical protein
MIICMTYVITVTVSFALSKTQSSATFKRNVRTAYMQDHIRDASNGTRSGFIFLFDNRDRLTFRNVDFL